MTEYTIRHHVIGDIAVIAVGGGGDDNCAEEMEALLDRFAAEGYTKFILDLGDLSYVETPALRLLIRKGGELRESGGALVVVRLAGRVARAFDLLKLGSVVPAADDLRSAVSWLSDSSPAEVGTGTRG